MADIFGSFLTMIQARLLRWDEILGTPKPMASQVSLAFWRHARALAYIAKRDYGAAKAEQAEFEKLSKTLDRNSPWSTNKLGDVLHFASAALTARMEPSAAKSVPLWRKAVELQDGLAYDEPPAWYYPVRESLGAALLLAGDAAGAEAVFRDGLRRSPNNGRILFGLLESLKAQRKSDAIRWVEREFEVAWKGADLQLRLKDL
jgi:hypothetical protein